MSTKRTQFFDGFNSETTPDTVLVAASGVIGTWRGAWTSQNYVLNDAVYFEGSSYICILDTVSNEDPNNATYWNLVSLKGESVDIDESEIELTEAKIATIEALGGITPLNRYMITVSTDSRSNQALPAEIAGDMELNLLTWDGTVWKNHGQFIGSTGQASNLMIREIPAGAIDGVNTSFTLTNAPTSDQHVTVFIDGNFLEDSEFSLVSNSLTLTTAPALGQSIFAWYSFSGELPSLPGQENIEYHTVTAGEEIAKQFNLSNVPVNVNKVLVDVIGGTSQHLAVDFTISGSTFNWNGLGLDGLLAENDVVRLKYFS